MTVELHMLPIKAGDATLIIDRSRERPYTVLIDAGLAHDEIVSYLQSVGVFHIDLIILSHPDMDHLQGLISLVNNPLISITQIWCFDLSFLREFVTTGKIPPPKKPTRKIIYRWLLRTLDGMDRVLKRLGDRDVLALQVSAGHRLTLGSLYIEVLYPWDGFYDALRSPRRIKDLLTKRWPADWVPPEWATSEVDREQPVPAHKITASQEQGIRDRLIESLDSRDEEVAHKPLVTAEDEGPWSEDEELPNDADCLPISTIGTLYNNLSIVVKIHVLGGVAPPTMLFPGDLTDWTYLLTRRPTDLAADIFKYPHHGSAGAGVSQRAIRDFG